jgi:hypothetical protein
MCRSKRPQVRAVEPPIWAVVGGTALPTGPANSVGKSLTWPARNSTATVPLVNALALTRACEAPVAHTMAYGPFADTVATY